MFFDLAVCRLAGINCSSDRFNLSVDVCLDVDLFAALAVSMSKSSRAQPASSVIVQKSLHVSHGPKGLRVAGCRLTTG